MSPIHEFRDALRAEVTQCEPPSLATLLQRGGPAQVLQWQWAVTAAVLIGLGAFPVFRGEREVDDDRLMEQVNEAVSRQAPRAFSALMMGEN